MDYKYTLRAHHGMCLAFFKGKGYSENFVKNMKKIQKELKENPFLRVKIVSATEDICCKCPDNINGKCRNYRKVMNYDNKVLECCGIKSGTILTFSDFENLINDKILAKGIREKICGDCQWTDICH